jgi:hypothetical protein
VLPQTTRLEYVPLRLKLQKFPFPIAPLGFLHVLRLYLQGGGGVDIGEGFTVTLSSCTITGNTAVSVRAHAQNFPLPQWESCRRACPRLTLALLQTLRSTTGCTCHRDLEKFPSPRWETHVCSACCLQGGGVRVGEGTVTVSSCTISGNAAANVCTLMFKTSHPPDGRLTCCLLFAGRRCLCPEWRHSGHLIVRHQWEQCAHSRSIVPIAPMGFSHSFLHLCLQPEYGWFGGPTTPKTQFAVAWVVMLFFLLLCVSLPTAIALTDEEE